MKAAIAVILILWAGLSRVQAYGLNELLGIPLWNSESLWNDTAKDTAQRLDLEGTANGAGEFYRRSFYGQRNVLGVKLYAMDLYCNEGRVQRVVLGFLNQADLVNAVGYSNSKLVDLDKNLRQDEGTARTKLIQRLGQPVVEDTTEIWSWNGHLFRLRRDSQSLTLSIEKGQYSPTRATDGKIYEQDQKRTDLSSNVRRTSSGDVYIDDIPPISQGDRGFCVPAAWEKYLRYYGLSFNVYELADKGSTNIFGSLWMPFADRVSGKLTPYGYKVQYVAGRPWEFETLKTYVDQGMPLLWATDAQLLEEWVVRNRARTTQLPASPRYTSLTPKIAGHGILIIGYNANFKEIALSDSTELGHEIPQIWVPAEEIKLCDMRQRAIVILPPNSRVAPSTGFLRPRWY